MTIEELLDALKLGEDQDVEFKAAQGGFPKSVWETVSAFANTSGGNIILGVTENNGEFEIVGISKPHALIKDFWDTHNSPQKLNYPVCRDADVHTLTIDKRTVICIQIPHLSRQQRPIYINGNPIGGTFKRNYEGDYRCTEAEVKMMLRDAAEDPTDGRILEGFSIEDLDAEALMAYRNRFASRNPDHPFLAKSDRDLLESLGGWRRDRISKIEGVTLAGILMFGKERSILDALPHFCQTLDELERTILMLAHHFNEVDNKDIQQYRNEHSRDIGDLLRKFVASGWLKKSGHGSGTRYQWPKSPLDTSEHLPDTIQHLPDTIQHLPDTIQHLPDTIQHLPDTIQHLPDTIQHLPDTIQHLDPETEQKLLQIALPISNAGKKASKAMIEETILALCEIDWLTLRTLAHLLDRKPDYLSNHYISRMLKDGRLETKIPEMPRHPGQAYRKKEANNHEI